MEGVALLTCLNNSFDRNLAVVFAREGCQVYAIGDTPVTGTALLPLDVNEAAAILQAEAGHLDFLLDTTDFNDPSDAAPLGNLDWAVIERVYRQNVLRSMAILETFLPLLDAGQGKRLFYLTSALASVNETRRMDHFGYNMSKAALHQFLQMTRNKLAPKGYTFRAFDPMKGQISPEAAVEGAFRYITRRRAVEGPLRDDEDNLVFRDAEGRQHAW